MVKAFIILVSAWLSWSCRSDNADSKTAKPSADTANSATDYKYDLAHPQKKWQLHMDLMEISGNTWVDKDHILAIEDLTPNLYLLKLDENSASVEKKILFREGKDPEKKFDVEDVVLVNNT